MAAVSAVLANILHDLAEHLPINASPKKELHQAIDLAAKEEEVTPDAQV